MDDRILAVEEAPTAETTPVGPPPTHKHVHVTWDPIAGDTTFDVSDNIRAIPEVLGLMLRGIREPSSMEKVPADPDRPGIRWVKITKNIEIGSVCCQASDNFDSSDEIAGLLQMSMLDYYIGQKQAQAQQARQAAIQAARQQQQGILLAQGQPSMPAYNPRKRR